MVVNDNEGFYAHTVGTDLFYTLYEVRVSAFNNIGHGPQSPSAYVYSAENSKNALHYML